MMAASPVVVFQALGSQAPAATALESLKQQDGFRRAYFGVKMEDPGTGILCTEWSSHEAARSYCASAPGTSVGAKETLGFVAAGGKQQDVLSVLGAACTEVFTALGAEDGFVANVERFVGAMDANPPEGYKGAAFAESVQLAAAADQQDKIVRMVIGWTSRDAHIEAKGKPGAIQDNIHELRVLRKAVDLFHVAFREL